MAIQDIRHIILLKKKKKTRALRNKGQKCVGRFRIPFMKTQVLKRLVEKKSSKKLSNFRKTHMEHEIYQKRRRKQDLEQNYIWKLCRISGSITKISRHNKSTKISYQKSTLRFLTWWGQPAGMKTASPSFCTTVQGSTPTMTVSIYNRDKNGKSVLSITI